MHCHYPAGYCVIQTIYVFHRVLLLDYRNVICVPPVSLPPVRKTHPERALRIESRNKLSGVDTRILQEK